jgi:hypothetical protein
MSKNLLILCARSDSCDAEVGLIEAVGTLCGMNICKETIIKEDDLKGCLCGRNNKKWDYVYLDTHADIHGFGDAYGGLDLKWSKFAKVVCEADCLAEGSMLFLGCCRGGLRSVANRLFGNCNQIDYVCGPRWTLTPDDVAAAFHVFIYNLETRREQPSVAVERASQGTGYDFFCYDRAELEDAVWSMEDSDTVTGNQQTADNKDATCGDSAEAESCQLPRP